MLPACDGGGQIDAGADGADAIHAYAQRTNLPAYTRNTLAQLEPLQENCLAPASEAMHWIMKKPKSG
ncbi:MAG: hypothetical protein R3E89_16105 [Thiolinea sp.]